MFENKSDTPCKLTLNISRLMTALAVLSVIQLQVRPSLLEPSPTSNLVLEVIGELK